MPSPAGPSPILSPEQAKKILEKSVANIAKKALAGKTLTTKEWAQIEQFTQETGIDPLKGPAPEWVSSYAKLGDIVRLHRASFPRLIREYKDDPLLPTPRDNGDHNVEAWRKFIEARGIQCKSGEQDSLAPTAPEDKSKGELEREKLIEQILTIRRKREGADKEFLSSIAEQLRILGEDLKAKLRTILEDQLPPKLQGKTAAAIRVEMKQVNDKICAEFHTTTARILAKTDAGASLT